MNNGVFCSAIIVAAGSGTRIKSPISKQFLNLNEKPIIAHTLLKFQNCEEIDEIIIVTKKEYISFVKEDIVEKYNIGKASKIVEGGTQRQDSVYNGLCNVSDKASIILVHDGVRPFVKIQEIVETISQAKISGASVLGVLVKDTIKVCDNSHKVLATPKRDTLWAIQTPQAFSKDILTRAFDCVLKEGFMATDESGLVERIGVDVCVVQGSYMNIKITTIEDLAIGEVFLSMEENQ